jgi:hypothetical protein
MAVYFKPELGVIKQDRLLLAPSVSTAFNDEHAEDYFIAMGWATETNDEPTVTYPEGSVTVDPKVVFGSGEKKGQFVMPELAKAADEASAAPSNSEGQEA